MFNLIRKDILLQKTTLLILLPLLVVFLFMENSYVWIGIIFSISIVMNAYSVDEKSASHILLNSLPYTRKEIVSSKYIGTFIFVGSVVFTIFIGNLIIHQEIMMWKDILLIVSSVMVAISLLFPFSYKFKSQYMLIGALVSLAIYLVIIPLFIPNVNDKIREFVQTVLTLQTAQFYLFIALSVMVLYTCSWLLSIHIYRKKVF
ncbi:ABC-2 transporter permease [Sporosarcina sp. FSL K6-1508]|uniref:ABC-2 transporter permease n=1 Tax=Sporosarcina sp. FSL K6-1508 TaxID=2921553 RepID=UPI0030FC823F